MITIQKVSGDSQYFQRDDYYSNEAQNTWTFGAENLKENFDVDLDRIGETRVFDQLVEAGVGSKDMVGQDITFSAPKDVSLLGALGDRKQQEIAYQAHKQAVEKTLNFVDKNGYIYTRETHNGETKYVAGHGIAAVAFDHQLSRDKDPQLHTHVVILNQTTRSSDGQVRAIDFARTLKGADRKQLDMIYKSEISRYLQDHGIRTEWTKDGRDFHIAGITDEQRQAFSQREQNILQHAEEKGLNMQNQREREQAILETRRSKGTTDFSQIRQEWQERANSVGLDIQKAVRENKLTREKITNIKQNYELKAESEASAKVLGMMQGVFSKGEFFAQASIFAHQLGREFDMQTTEKSFAFLQKQQDVFSLGKDAGEKVYATKDFIQAERYLANSVNQDLQQGTFVSREQFQADMEEFREQFREQNGFWLSDEQEQALEKIYTSDRAINGIQGYAGVGKSALFKAANEYGKWLGERYGADRAVHFVGMAPTGQAAKVLEESSGIKSTTIHSTLKENKISNPSSKERTIAIIDETGMADSRLLANVVQAADKAGAKLVLSGDTNQFQSVGAGKAFEMMQRKGMDTAHITGIRRQKDPEVRAALKSFADGNPKKLQELIERRGWIHEQDKKGMNNAIQEKYTELLQKTGNDPSKVLVLAQTNKTVERLNTDIRKYLVENGIVSKDGVKIEIEKGKINAILARDIKNDFGIQKTEVKKIFVGETKVEQKEFAAGDRVIFLKNDKQIGVQNGLQGTIESIEKNLENNSATLTVNLDNNQKITFSTDQYNHFNYAYAITTHKAQGATVEHAIFVHEGNANKNAIYVAMTRAKKETHIFTADKKSLYKDMRTKQENKSALERLGKKRLEKLVANSVSSSQRYYKNPNSKAVTKAKGR